MARIRTIKPGMSRDRKLAKLSEPAFILATHILPHCDDEGYFLADEALIKADVFPLREPSRSITVLLQELSKSHYIELFQGSDGEEYGLVKNFTKHQVINKPKPSDIKRFHVIPEEYGTDTGGLPLGKEGKGREGKENGTAVPDPEKAENKKPDPEDLKLSKFMFDSILTVAEKTKPPNFDKWADQIRLMRERDNLSLREIRDVFVWANRDDFWQENILSPAKLREKFPRLHAASKKSKPPQNDIQGVMV